MEQPYLFAPKANPEPPVPDERTFQRDMKLLLRHRQWGFNIPAVDIDFLEYDNRKSVALIEYKRASDLAECNPNLTDANLQALVDLGDRASIPVFCTFYKSLKWYRVFPVNEIAKQKGPPEGILSEYKYVDFLYWLKGRQMPDHIREKLW